MDQADKRGGRGAMLGTALAAAVLLVGAIPVFAADEPTVTLMTHDSFYLPDEVWREAA